MTMESCPRRHSSAIAVISWIGNSCWIVSLLLGVAFAHSAPAAGEGAARVEAQRLIAAAAQAEIAGDTPRCLSLLNAAVRNDPENKIARWQLGQIQLDGKWVTVEEAQHRAAADPVQAAYNQRRTAAGPTLPDQLALARWCRKNQLNDEALFHWATVLSLDPTNEDALRAVNMRWQDGRLVSRIEIAQQKQQARAARNASKHWEPIVSKWQRAVGGRDDSARDAALAEIRSITRPDAIPSIEPVTLGGDAFDTKHAIKCSQIAVAFLDALEQMPDQAATESLVRHAVLSPGHVARIAAIERLKPRPQADYVPLLLDNLAMPIESSFSVTTSSVGSVYYSHSLYREGQFSDLAIDASYYSLQHVLPGRDLVWRSGLRVLEDQTDRQVASNAQRSQNKYGAKAAAIDSQVQNENLAAEALALRISPVLTATTGKEFSTAKQWWEWWRENNEYYASEHPVEHRYYSDTEHYYSGQPKDTYRSVLSCFTIGTPVWTKSGPKPIETLELGDLVLSQDVTSGELKYKPIVAKTTRPPSPILIISLENDELHATKGHPFWVAGVGWRMAKELGEDANLHGVTGASRVRSIELAAEAEAYNLVVADFNTYFVGESGILVHDNTPRRPTRATVPGLTAK